MCDRRITIGIDFYNQSATGMVAKTLNAKSSDADHVPCVLTKAVSLEVFHCVSEKEKTVPLKARDYKDPLVVAYECDNNNDEYLSDGE